LHTVQAPQRLGGETRPYVYPHLYQIQAGDWRISYAVEQNRLAILVLEVLNPDGTVVEDPIRETLNRKMKVKLLDWPEGSPSRDLLPEDLGRKVKIRLMDLADEAVAETIPSAPVKSPGSKAQRSRSAVRLVEPQASHPAADSADQATGLDRADRKVTPLDSPTM